MIMKKIITLSVFAVFIPLLFAAFILKDTSSPTANSYIVVAWNDLGMHCANKDFSNMCILPPYNNQSAHVIQVGDQNNMPVVMNPSTSGITVSYSIPGNTYSGSTTNTDKTNFWVYAFHIFGVNLQPNIGLTGLGLTGTMADSNNFYHAAGIPITPYQDNDLANPDPYQLTLIEARNSGNQLIASTQSVIPVSNEINCVSSGCHSSEMDILNEHESVTGFNIADKPILCATCHADNALGMPGQAGVPPFSQVIHQKHGSETNDCYKCHPGPNTQCYRDTMKTKGLTCQTCHGSVSNVGNTVENGRQPWLQEPQCGSSACHGPNFAEEPGKLYRKSKGHGGLICSTCHGSPHAIFTSENARDNIQNIALQGFSGILKKCEVCHGYIPAAPGPHGYNPVGITPISFELPDKTEILQNYPNPCNYMTNIPYHVKTAGPVVMDIYNLNGEKITNLVNDNLQPGKYKAELYTSKLPAGTYICSLRANGKRDYKKISVIK
jgi:hypothetical protein